MTIQEAMIKIFDEHKKSMAEWEKIAGVSRQQIYRWKKGDVDNIRETSLVAVAKAVGYKCIFNGDYVELERRAEDQQMIDMNTLEKYVTLLEEKVQALKDEIVGLRDRITNGNL